MPKKEKVSVGYRKLVIVGRYIRGKKCELKKRYYFE
jgi:hypothetical protein